MSDLAENAPAAPEAAELVPAIAHGVVAPATPGAGVPGISAAGVRHPGEDAPSDVKIIALAVPGQPDGEVDTRPHARPRRHGVARPVR